MKEFLRNFFKKTSDDDIVSDINAQSNAKFLVKIEGLIVGMLSKKDNLWQFQYSDEFKNQQEFYRLVGFSDLDKTYQSEILWPFFKIRIPGLKQPMVQEIISSEKLNPSDEATLLRKFGRKSISNPYILEAI